MIDYKIFNEDQIFDCYSSSIASICALQNMDFEAMFLKSWNYTFSFFMINSLIGGSVMMDLNLLNQSLLDFHGIQVVSKQIDDEGAFYSYYTQNHLSKLGCAISYDSFHAPWLTDYQKEHNTHISLIKDIDKSGKLTCADGIPYVEKATLPISSLFSKKPVFIYSCKKICNVDHIDYPGVLKDLYDLFYSNNTPFELIKKYGDIIKDNFVLQNENIFDNTTYWYLAPFLTDLKNMAQKRKSMSYTLEYLHKRYQDDRLIPLKTGLDELADLWYQLVMICWKIFMSHQFSDAQARHIISEYIYKCAKKEETVSKKLKL